jgi:hypothetical protein
MKKVKKSNKHFFPVIGGVLLLLVTSFIFLKKQPIRNQDTQVEYPPQIIKETPEQLSGVTKVIGHGKPQGQSAGWVPFELDIPSGWKLVDRADDLPGRLAKGDYSLGIVYPMEGSVCNFPDTEPIEGPSGNYEIQSEFKTEFGTVRLGRSKYRPDLDLKYQSFALCQKEKYSEYWAAVLPIGAIGYKTPLNPDMRVINEMNNIVKSIRLTQ